MPSDTPEQLYILRNYQNGLFLKQFKAQKQMGDDKYDSRRIWEWATSTGSTWLTYSDANVPIQKGGFMLDGMRYIIRPEQREVKELGKQFRKENAPSKEKKNPRTKRQPKDTRTKRTPEGRFTKGYVPPQPRQYNRDLKGRFIRENLLVLSLLDQRPNSKTPDAQKEREVIQRNLTQPTNEQERRREKVLDSYYNKLVNMRQERDNLSRKIIAQKNNLSQIQSRAGSSEISKPEKVLMNSIKMSEQQREKANAEVLRLQEIIFSANGNRTGMAEEFSDDDFLSFSPISKGRSGSSISSSSSSSSDDDGREFTPATQTPSNGPMLDETVTVNLQNSWTNLYQIQGVGRKPIRLKDILSWMETWAQWRFCDGLRRAQEGLRQRPFSFFTKFMFAQSAKIFNMVRQQQLSTFRIGENGNRIMWANKEVFPVANPSFFDGDIEINGYNGPYALQPVLYNPENFHFSFERPNGAKLIHPVISQASAVTETHVILIKANVGMQMTEKKTTAYGDETEKYRIDDRKLIEMMFLMCAYNKNRGKIVSFYDPHPVITAVDNLVKNKYPNGIPEGTIIYKPWFDYQKDRIKTLLGMPLRVLKHAWYQFCWNLNVDDGPMGRREDWSPRNLGNGTRRRRIYDQGVVRMNQIYNTFILEWGQVEGDDIVEAQTTEPLDTPLVAFERLDDVFTPENIRNLILSFQNSINTELTEEEGLPALALDLLAVGKKMYTALYTKKVRNVKRGIVQGTVGDNPNLYRVKWDLPDREYDGANVANVERQLTLDEILSRHRMVASFFLSKLVRMKPLYFSGNAEARGVKLEDKLRTGDALEAKWTRRTNGETFLHKKLHDHAKKDHVTIEIDATGTVPNSNVLLMDKFKGFLSDLMQQFNRINTIECRGRGDTVSRGVQAIKEEIKSFFGQIGGNNDVPRQQCVNRFCTVLSHGQNY
jgi:hypothetical protein